MRLFDLGNPGAQFPPCGGGTPGTAFPAGAFGFDAADCRLPLSLRAEGAPQGGLSCPSGNSPSGNLLVGSLSSYAVPGDSHGLRPRNDRFGDCTLIWYGRLSNRVGWGVTPPYKKALPPRWGGRQICFFGRYSCSMSSLSVMLSKKSSIILPSLAHMARLWQLRSQAASQETGLKLPSVSRRISPTE